MNEYANPTPLRIGMAATLSGIHYRVVGRAVLGMTEAGETYYWNEFNLLDDAGQSATLVFEETEDGPTWKLFMYFEPTYPLTAAEAASKKVGDLVSLDGTAAEVTFVGRSRVYHIEGRGPEGEDIGDIANYLNCDAGPQMLVVSWTGDEVECYRGMTLPPDDVANAFHFPRNAAYRPTGLGLAATGTPATTGPSSSRGLILVIGAVVAALLGYGVYSAMRQPAPIKKQPARTAMLTVGAAGTLSAHPYTITGHAVVEIARVGARYDCHQYDLRDDAGNVLLLTGGLTGANDWRLFKPWQPANPLTPPQAAAKTRGSAVTLGDRTLVVHDLFQMRPAAFGFLARSTNEWAMVLWTQDSIRFYLGTPVAEKDVLAAFTKKPGKTP